MNASKYDFNKLKELCRPETDDKLQKFINTTVDYASSLSIATKSVVVLKQKQVPAKTAQQTEPTRTSF
jgi:hypothetical protein